MSEYRLFIDTREVDVPDDEIILFSKQRTDYTNPTIVRNSFSKTVKLPGTKNNNLIFNDIWKLDRVQFDGSFNASKRTPFILLKNGSLMETGYVKLNNVLYDGKFYSYDVTLFGEVGNILYKLSYKIDGDNDVSPLTLADLDFGFSGFSISRSFVTQAWNYLKTGVGNENFGKINFCVSYDGVPKLDKFDTKKVWTEAQYRNITGGVFWDNVGYSEMPQEITNEGVRYTTVKTMITKSDPNDTYGLLEFKTDLTPLEARDLRSYLLRPILSMSSIFAAIDGFLQSEMGYSLDMSDEFFSSDEFKETWMTLSMLYEIYPDIESYYSVKLKDILYNTSSPANYLISYCKIYGIYIDVDVVNKKILLRRLPNFFKDEIQELKIDKGRDIKINPLSFDKATYTFDYADGDGEFIKKYKEHYGYKFGSQRVNTGYSFDSSEAPYISNNIFKSAVDVVEQSMFYLCNVEGSGVSSNVREFPIGIYDPANLPEYKLFNGKDRYGGVMSYDAAGETTIDAGTYMMMDDRWKGLKVGVYQDGFPKVQFHSDGNKSVDGKNVLVRYNGFKVTYRGIDDGLTFFRYVNEPVKYLVSDDSWLLRDKIDKNCYYDNPSPDMAAPGNYISQVTELPSFTTTKFDYEMGSEYPEFLTRFDTRSIYGYPGVSIYKGINYFDTTVVRGAGRKYSYVRLPDGKIKDSHRYLLMSIVQTDDYNEIRSNNPYAFPFITNGEVIDTRGLDANKEEQMLFSYIEAHQVETSMIFAPLSTYDLEVSVEFETRAMAIFDLTEMGMDSYDNVDDVVDALGLSLDNFGYDYKMLETFNFGRTRELYVPATIMKNNATIYERFWRKYISDVYSINSKVMDCYCFLDNNEDMFRIFYYYDNCLWILSKISDWTSPGKVCKATFIKVNNKDNYLSV